MTIPTPLGSKIGFNNNICTNSYMIIMVTIQFAEND